MIGERFPKVRKKSPSFAWIVMDSSLPVLLEGCSLLLLPRLIPTPQLKAVAQSQWPCHGLGGSEREEAEHLKVAAVQRRVRPLQHVLMMSVVM
jgi:hypothetical protein